MTLEKPLPEIKKSATTLQISGWTLSLILCMWATVIFNHSDGTLPWIHASLQILRSIWPISLPSRALRQSVLSKVNLLSAKSVSTGGWILSCESVLWGSLVLRCGLKYCCQQSKTLLDSECSLPFLSLAAVSCFVFLLNKFLRALKRLWLLVFVESSLVF